MAISLAPLKPCVRWGARVLLLVVALLAFSVPAMASTHAAPAKTAPRSGVAG